jgi:hypothetical protein
VPTLPQQSMQHLVTDYRSLLDAISREDDAIGVATEVAAHWLAIVHEPPTGHAIPTDRVKIARVPGACLGLCPPARVHRGRCAAAAFAGTARVAS